MRKRISYCLTVVALFFPLSILCGCAGGGSSQFPNTLDPLVPQAAAPLSNHVVRTAATNQAAFSCLSSGEEHLSARISVIDENDGLIDIIDLCNFQITHHGPEYLNNDLNILAKEGRGRVHQNTKDEKIPESDAGNSEPSRNSRHLYFFKTAQHNGASAAQVVALKSDGLTDNIGAAFKIAFNP